MSTPVTVTIPGLLTRFTEGERELELAGATVTEAVDHLLDAHPDLEVHLFDEGGRLRTHLVLCHNGRPVTWPDSDEIELEVGDELLILQAVSGG